MITTTQILASYNDRANPVRLERLEEGIDARLTETWEPGKKVVIDLPPWATPREVDITCERYRAAGWTVTLLGTYSASGAGTLHFSSAN